MVSRGGCPGPASKFFRGSLRIIGEQQPRAPPHFLPRVCREFQHFAKFSNFAKIENFAKCWNSQPTGAEQQSAVPMESAELADPGGEDIRGRGSSFAGEKIAPGPGSSAGREHGLPETVLSVFGAHLPGTCPARRPRSNLKPLRACAAPERPGAARSATGARERALADFLYSAIFGAQSRETTRAPLPPWAQWCCQLWLGSAELAEANHSWQHHCAHGGCEFQHSARIPITGSREIRPANAARNNRGGAALPGIPLMH